MIPAALEHGLAISQVLYLDHASGAPLTNRARPAAGGLLPLEEIYLACLHSYAAVAFDREVVRHAWREEVPLLEDAAVAPMAVRLGMTKREAVRRIGEPTRQGGGEVIYERDARSEAGGYYSRLTLKFVRGKLALVSFEKSDMR